MIMFVWGRAYLSGFDASSSVLTVAVAKLTIFEVFLKVIISVYPVKWSDTYDFSVLYKYIYIYTENLVYLLLITWYTIGFIKALLPKYLFLSFQLVHAD